MVGSRGVYEALKKLFVTDKDGHITIDGLPDVTVDNWPTEYPDTATEPRNISKWGGTALTGRDISLDLKTLTDTKDTNLFNAHMIRNEREIALGAGKLFGAVALVTGGGGQYAAIKLSNPNGSGVTLRLKQLNIYASAASTPSLYIDGAPANMGAATPGLNRKQGGAAAQGTIASSTNAGAQPALTGACGGYTVGGINIATVLCDLELSANHSVTLWENVAAVTIAVTFEWIEY